MERYGRLSHTVAKSRKLSAQAKVVYTVLDMCRNPKTGKCNPKQTTLAELSGMSRKATNRAIKELKKGGFIAISGTRRRSYYRLQTNLFADAISPNVGTNAAEASISPTDGTNGEPFEAHEKASISPTSGTNENVDNLAQASVDNSEIDAPLVPPMGQVLVPPVGQRSRKAKGKEKGKRTPLTPRGENQPVLVLKFAGKPDACMLQRLRRYFAFDPARREWTSTNSAASREIWEDTQEQYQDAVIASERTAETKQGEE